MSSIEFFGERFTTTDETNEFALMEFADAAQTVETNTLPAMAAVYRLLQETIVESDWERFKLVARKNKATSDDLMQIIFGVVSEAADRPTSPPADSSVGREVTPLRSVSAPVDPALQEALNRQAGRPDQQAAILMARGVLSAVAG